jgi:iron(III) transport system substrate-binding protein
MNKWSTLPHAGLILLASICILSVSGQASGQKLNVIAEYRAQEEVFERFSSDTGIEVKLLDQSLNEVLTGLRSGEGPPPADVWFGGRIESFIDAKQDGLLQEYVSPEARQVQARFKDKDGYWTGVYLQIVDFVVNTAILEAKGLQLPRSWSELIRPEFNGEVLMPNPASSEVGYFILYALLAQKGRPDGWDFFKKLDANIPFYTRRGTQPPQKAAVGEAIVGLAPGLWPELQDQGYPIVHVFPEDGLFWWPVPIAIFKGARELDLAKRLVDWALSRQGQRYLLAKGPYFPVRSDLTLPEALQGLDPNDLIRLDFTQAGKEREQIVQDWREQFGQ